MRWLALLLVSAALGWSAQTSLNFPVGGYTNYGTWSGEVRVSPGFWRPG